MTTVQIATCDPLDTRYRAEVQKVLDGQSGPSATGLKRLLSYLEEHGAGPYTAFVRAVLQADDGMEDKLLGGGLIVDFRHPGEEQDRPWLAALWVDPEHRGRGLGRRLAQIAENVARERGGQEMVVRAHPDDDATLFMTERWGYFREEYLISKNL